MQLSLTALAIFTLLASVSVHAVETSTLNSSVRALGMGDAYTALADDESSLFYNPAGLARVRGINWKIFDLDAGTSGLTTYQSFKNLESGSGNSFANAISSLYGQHVWVGAGGESMFTMPCLGFGVYDHASATLRINNPVYPTVGANVINDYGYVMGVGVPVSPVFHMGFDLKYIKRTGTEQNFGPASLADLQTNNIESALTGWGTGYGADLGVNLIIPAPLFSATLAAAWKNVGGITFTSNNGSQIPSEENNITLGAGLKFSLPLVTISPDVDVVYLNDPNLQITRKINFGIEFSLPLIDIRGGFHEGYYTAGVGAKLGLIRVDAATYGVELGDYPGQLEDRRYIVQLTMELGVGNFSATDDGKKNADGSSSSSSSNSDNSSIWGGTRLKQRR